MRRPSPLHRSRVLDLIAFVMVLATGVTLVALGLSPESLAAVAIGLASLYSVWRAGQPSVPPAVETEQSRQPGPRPAGKAPEGAEHVAGEAGETASTR